jgi:hypothetical protein
MFLDNPKLLSKAAAYVRSAGTPKQKTKLRLVADKNLKLPLGGVA